jgi:ribulokinase
LKYLLGIDFGTGGTKACLTDAALDPLAYSFREYPIYTDKLDFSEHDPALYWRCTCDNIHSCMEQAGISGKDIAAVAVSAAMPSLVLTDGDGAALGRAVNLMDKRAKREMAETAEMIGIEPYFSITGNQLEDHPCIINLLWIKRHEPDLFARAARAHTVDGYINFLLTGIHNVNRSNAMFMGAYDLRKGAFDRDMLHKLGLPPELFPAVTDCTDIIGTVLPGAAQQTGLLAGTPVMSGQTDCNAGWLGAGAVRPGDIQMNLGTCGNFGIIVEGTEFLPGTINFSYTVPGTYITVPTTTTGGILMRYMRDNFSQLEKATEALTGIDAYELLNRQAEKIPPGSGGLIMLPYLMGERTPIWDANARGTVFGLSLRHTKGHLIRAMMESVAYALYHSYEMLALPAGTVNFPLVLNEGGAKSVLWRRIITDVFNIPTVLAKNRAGAPYGDCLLAGVGAGIIESFDIACEKAEYIGLMEPDPKAHAIYMDYFGIYKSLYPLLKEQFAQLARVNARYQQ